VTQASEKKNARQREYRKANPEKIREQRHDSYIRNREGISERRRLWRIENPEAARKRDRDGDRRRKTKRKPAVPPEEWAAMWEQQDGRCYLCGTPLNGKVHVDHDHSCCPQNRSCRICRRGLACSQCNMAIGLANDDPGRLRQMADALEAAQAAVGRRRTVGEQLQFPAPV
jgi:hypothetical protein